MNQTYAEKLLCNQPFGIRGRFLVVKSTGTLKSKEECTTQQMTLI